MVQVVLDSCNPYITRWLKLDVNHNRKKCEIKRSTRMFNGSVLKHENALTYL